jgi:hypothetical protein
MTQPPARAPLDPLQPLTPLQPSAPMQPLAQLVPMQPMAPRRPGEQRQPAPAREMTGGNYQTAPGYAPPAYDQQPAQVAIMPPPAQQPQVVNLGLSQSSPVPNWGGVPRPRVPVPIQRPQGNKAAVFIVAVVAVFVAVGASGVFKSSSGGTPDVSIPQVSVSIPPVSIGSHGGTTLGSSGHSGGSRTGATQPAHQAGRTLDLNGNRDGERIRVSFRRLVNNATPKDTFRDSPDSGKRLVAAQFRVTNIGSFLYVASATAAAHVVDTKGHTYDAQFLFDSLREGKAFNGVINVNTGKSTVGFIAFEVPKKAKIKRVEFSASSSGGQTGTWTFVRS